MEKYYVTREGYEKLIMEEAKLEEDFNKTTKSMAELKADDIHAQDNPAYLQELATANHYFPKKERQLNENFYNAVIIEETDEYKNWDGVTVIRKSRVEILDDDEIECYDILGKNESDFENNILSCDAPLVLAILGHKKGETVIFDNRQIKILEVEKIEEVREKEETRVAVKQR